MRKSNTKRTGYSIASVLDRVFFYVTDNLRRIRKFLRGQLKCFERIIGYVDFFFFLTGRWMVFGGRWRFRFMAYVMQLISNKI